MARDSHRLLAWIDMNREDFLAIREIIGERCGIHLDEENVYRLERVLQPRLRSLGLTSFTPYRRLLQRADGASEIERLVDSITNNETYFFREEFQLRAFSDEILPALVDLRRRRRRLTIWSAGCASGEEPYTIAMLILQSGLCAGWEVRILGTDINRRMISRARQATYDSSSFKGMSPAAAREIQGQFFDWEGNRHRIRQDVRRMCSFLHLNLLDRDGLGVIGEVDVVFCRNVLIYFRRATRLEVVGGFYDKLAVGGYLLLGHSENLLDNETPFRAIRLRNDLVYQKLPGSRADIPVTDG